MEYTEVKTDQVDEVEGVVLDHRFGGGYTLRFPAGDYIADQIRRRSAPYEFQLLAFLRSALPENAVVIDVGANVGNHSVYLAVAAGATVHAFEPFDEALRLLRHNVSANGLDDRITIRDVALGAVRGSAHLDLRRPDNLGATSFVTGSGSVPVVPLDDFVFDRVDLIKIDVEGAEIDVLGGARRTIAEHRPLIVAEAMDSAFLGALEDEFDRLGYRRWSQNLSPLCTPTYLFAASRRDLIRAIAPNVPRVAMRRIRKKLRL